MYGIIPVVSSIPDKLNNEVHCIQNGSFNSYVAVYRTPNCWNNRACVDSGMDVGDDQCRTHRHISKSGFLYHQFLHNSARDTRGLHELKFQPNLQNDETAADRKRRRTTK